MYNHISPFPIPSLNSSHNPPHISLPDFMFSSSSFLFSVTHWVWWFPYPHGCKHLLEQEQPARGLTHKDNWLSLPQQLLIVTDSSARVEHHEPPPSMLECWLDWSCIDFSRQLHILRVCWAMGLSCPEDTVSQLSSLTSASYSLLASPMWCFLSHGVGKMWNRYPT